MFFDDLLVPSNPFHKRSRLREALSAAMSIVPDVTVAKVQPATDQARINHDAVFVQGSSLEECAQIVPVAQLSPTLVYAFLPGFTDVPVPPVRYGVTKGTPFITAQAAVSGRLFSLGCGVLCAAPFGAVVRDMR